MEPANSGPDQETGQAGRADGILRPIAILFLYITGNDRALEGREPRRTQPVLQPVTLSP